MKILMIEDEKLLADSVKALLEKRGFDVECVYDGISGAEYARLGIYDLLILDVTMPGMDGYHVAKSVRAKRCSTPILMLTARSGLEDRIEGLNAGADYYLTKPFDGRELLACVNALLRRQGGQVDAFSGRRLVFADVTSERATLRNLLETCAIVGLLCFGAFLCVSALLAAWMVKPVDKAWEQQRQFVADASHELKTPLAVIMTNAELLQSPGWAEGEQAKFLDSILTMSRQMRVLVERLLELARADSGQRGAAVETVDLSALAESALLPFEPLFFEQGLTLSGEIEPGVAVRGSGPQLRQVADILLDNARKYSGAEGRVMVVLKRAGKRHCRLSVSSPGEALSKNELKDIFKRFYRADKARSRDGGFGLGLSIAQSIAEQHHGRIWAESGGGLNTFCVELPAIPR